jgi:hypothetical protein
MFFMPESPRWLLSKGRKEECLRSLRFVVGKKNKHNKNYMDAEFAEIEKRVEALEALGKSHFWNAFNTRVPAGRSSTVPYLE